MQMVDFQWWWCRDGYRLEPEGDDFLLVSQSVRFVAYKPLDTRALFAIFAADTPPTSEGMRYFCGRFGMPGGTPADMRPHLAAHTAQWNLVSVLLDHQSKLRRALDLYEEGDSSEFVKRWNASGQAALMRPALRVGAEGRIEMVFEPLDLIQAMWFQLVQSACRGDELLRCERCNQPFVVGSGTGRRSTSKWCSNACKVAAFKERKAQP
jgi:hypothetical protein